MYIVLCKLITECKSSMNRLWTSCSKLVVLPRQKCHININQVLKVHRVIAFKVQEWITVPITELFLKSSFTVKFKTNVWGGYNPCILTSWPTESAILSKAEGHSYILQYLKFKFMQHFFCFTHSRIISENVYEMLGWLLQIFTAQGTVQCKIVEWKQLSSVKTIQDIATSTASYPIKIKPMLSWHI